MPKSFLIKEMTHFGHTKLLGVLVVNFLNMPMLGKRINAAFADDKMVQGLNEVCWQ
jgi:hypothetical protein